MFSFRWFFKFHIAASLWKIIKYAKDMAQKWRSIFRGTDWGFQVPKPSFLLLSIVKGWVLWTFSKTAKANCRLIILFYRDRVGFNPKSQSYTINWLKRNSTRVSPHPLLAISDEFSKSVILALSGETLNLKTEIQFLV